MVKCLESKNVSMRKIMTQCYTNLPCQPIQNARTHSRGVSSQKIFLSLLNLPVITISLWFIPSLTVHLLHFLQVLKREVWAGPRFCHTDNDIPVTSFDDTPTFVTNSSSTADISQCNRSTNLYPKKILVYWL